MMHFKRAIAGLMVFLSILLLPSCNDNGANKENISSSAEQTTDSDSVGKNTEMDISEFDFFLDPDGRSCSICRGEEPPKHEIMRIPEQYDGRTVTKIDSEGFKLVEGFNKLIVPDTVTEIGELAFCYCPDLETFEMGNGVETLGDNVFIGCEKLKNVTLSNKLTELPLGIFQSCAIETVTIPSSVQIIGENAFALCANLKEVHIPDSVKEIADLHGPFEGCPDVTIYAPSGSYAEEYAKRHGIPFSAE